MDELLKDLVLTSGGFILGGSLIVGLLLKISAGRYKDDVEGCLGKVVTWTGIVIASAFFIFYLFI